jgi:Uma2 family endonuclease
VVDRRTELLRGVIVEKMTKSPLHEYLSGRIYELALAAIRPGLSVRKEGPLTLIDSEPEPDVAVVDGTAEEFRKVHPVTALLVVEIAVSSEEIDREKIAIYAEAGVAEFWLVVPAIRTVEVYAQPEGKKYRERRVLGSGETVASATVPKLRVNVDALFG